MLSYLEREVIFGSLISDIKDILIVEESLVGKRSSSDPSNFNKSPSEKPTNPYTREEKEDDRIKEDRIKTTQERNNIMKKKEENKRIELGGETDTQIGRASHTESL